MSDFQAPLVPSQLTQTINPWSWTFGDFSVFTVNLGRSGDPKFEAKVLNRVGSYGRQLGRMGEAMTVLIAHLDREKLKPRERAVIRALERQLEEIADLKADQTPSIDGAVSAA